MSRLRRRSGDTSKLESAIDTILRDGAAPVTVEPLSDLTLAESKYVRGRWAAIPLERRQQTVSVMASLGDEDVRFNFERALLIALTDDEAEIRLSAVKALWETESTALLDALLESVNDEPSIRVRVAMIEALGRYARLANEGRIPDSLRQRVEPLLVDLASADPSEDIRLEALAAASYVRPAPLESMIFGVWESGHDDAREFALRAMGRFGGSQWAPPVIDALRAGDSDQRAEAARAAPYVEDEHVIPYLYEAAEDDEEPDLQLAAIAALGEIGGREIRSFLEELRDSTTGDVSSATETALANAELLEGVDKSLPR